jgi:hypothetical protein
MGTCPESDIPASQTRVSGVNIAIHLVVVFDVEHMPVVIVAATVVVVVVVVAVVVAAAQFMCIEIEVVLVAILDQIIIMSNCSIYILCVQQM